MDNKDEKDIQESLEETAKAETNIVKYGAEELAKDSMIGLSKVPMEDIRPPQILLIQKSSELADFVDTQGKQPALGQFFHTGKMQILDTFKCYFLFCAKSKYISKIKPEEGEKDQYRAIGVMADDLSTFGMVFRSSALFALSSLFTASISQKRPMFSIKVKIETKDLQNDKGKWWIPVCRIEEPEQDYEKLGVLAELAKRYDRKADVIVADLEEEDHGEKDADIPF